MTPRAILLKRLEHVLSELERSHHVPPPEAVRLIEERSLTIPVCIFSQNSLGPLEALVVYLRDEHAMTYARIAQLLKRNPDPIGITYRNARKKLIGPLKIRDCTHIPISVFQSDTLSIMECLVRHLKEAQRMRYCDIARLLNRDDRTIWTIYKRGKAKRP